jgi:dTDP-4-amino-4,6-dideoxygalactose transaminase
MGYYKNKYQYTNECFPVSFLWGEGCISLPLYPNLPLDQLDKIVSVIEENRELYES